MADNQPRTTPPTNLQHFNRLLSAFAETDEGMPVSRARHAFERRRDLFKVPGAPPDVDKAVEYLLDLIARVEAAND